MKGQGSKQEQVHTCPLSISLSHMHGKLLNVRDTEMRNNASNGRITQNR